MLMYLLRRDKSVDLDLNLMLLQTSLDIASRSSSSGVDIKSPQKVLEWAEFGWRLIFDLGEIQVGKGNWELVGLLIDTFFDSIQVLFCCALKPGTRKSKKALVLKTMVKTPN